MTPMGDDRRIRVQQVNDEPSLTKQSMKDTVDLNQIVERFRKTGLVSHLAQGQPRYLDVSEMGDYREAIEHVRSVNQFFQGLPANIRAEFQNDPAEYIDWITDPANAEEVEAMGLELEKPEPEPEPEPGPPEPAPEPEPEGDTN